MSLPAENSGYLYQAAAYLKTATYNQALKVYAAVIDDPSILQDEKDHVISNLCKTDRYFLLTQVLNREDAYHPWIYERCREVEAQPDGHLDLWARGHYKSTIITFAGSFQEIIKDPEITIGIFSHTRPIAKSFLDQIKQECELNPQLHYYWPDIFWENSRREAPSWSLDNGIVINRTANPKEKTVEAWGLVDGQPTSKHFKLRIYNDVVTEESVTGPEMILKTTLRWELSQNLAELEKDEGRPARQWHEGTRYHFSDTYGQIEARKALIPRIYPATEDGSIDGKPILLTEDAWKKKKSDSSKRTIACQQLLNPLAGSEQDFKLEWIRLYEIRPKTLNIAILCDPASSKKKGTSNTAMAVIGIDAARNKYTLDGACHKMSLSERWLMLKGLRAKWLRQPGIQQVSVFYEKYGHQTDVEHFEEMMKLEKGQSFHIEIVSWTKDHVDAKDDRIRRLIPDHQNWRWFYPYEGERTVKQMECQDAGLGYLLAKPIKRVNEDGNIYNLVQYMIDNEYMFFPATTKKDLLDAMSRFYDAEMNPPAIYNEKDLYPEVHND